MTLLVRLEPAAKREMFEAMEWYEAQAGLGTDFLDAVRATLELAAKLPNSFPLLRTDPRVHRALVRKFPYSIVFLEHEGLLRVIAVAHQRRAPGYWLPRL